MFAAFLFNILSSFSCIGAGAHDRPRSPPIGWAPKHPGGRKK
jgi:hypothetical protein